MPFGTFYDVLENGTVRPKHVKKINDLFTPRGLLGLDALRGRIDVGARAAYEAGEGDVELAC